MANPVATRVQTPGDGAAADWQAGTADAVVFCPAAFLFFLPAESTVEAIVERNVFGHHPRVIALCPSGAMRQDWLTAQVLADALRCEKWTIRCAARGVPHWQQVFLSHAGPGGGG